MARDYELGIIVNPDVGDDQARAIVERVTQTIASDDGQVVRVNAWGRRRLAYPIDRHRDGLYFFFDAILNPEATSELERSIRVNEDILRHLLKVRDSRVAAQQRQRDAEAEAQAAQAAEAQAAQAAEAQAAQAQAAQAQAAQAAEAQAAQAAEAQATEAPAETEPEAATEVAEPTAEPVAEVAEAEPAATEEAAEPAESEEETSATTEAEA